MHILINLSIIISAVLIGMQIDLNELKLLKGSYNYHIQKTQFVNFAAICMATLASGISLYLFFSNTSPYLWWSILLRLVSPCALIVIEEWALAKMNPSSSVFSWAVRFLFCALTETFVLHSPLPFVTYLFIGVYLRNTTFGIPFRKDLCLAYIFNRVMATPFESMEFVTETEAHQLPSTEFAGSMERPYTTALPLYNVADFGIKANNPEDVTESIQSLLDKIGMNGGGRVFFPKGRYLFNKKGNKFLQINYSNIVIEGEVDTKGTPLASLVNCGKTSRGQKNPWLSPFFITTGEQLQASNEFWGLPLRKAKETIVQSNSLSDPGSDGKILSSCITTRIIKDAAKGSLRLIVEDASQIGKYILMGMYNTENSNELICDILGVNALRPEWTIANRAGNEEAPSYQWLVEVKEVIDAHTIELVRPLLRDVSVKYDPVICNVAMLENIIIRNLKIESTWNGLFRHHGFPIYYNIAQAQEMDYGWNAINMKRCAHSKVENVIIQNFSNPMYVLDSRNITVKDITIKGYDGHQGIKIYMHTCDCLFEDITFHCHYADMMGGEGNAYANVFRRISYENPVFKPVDFDFHGFGSESMSPPSDNMFTMIRGFRYFKAAGSITHLPSNARKNIWWNIETEGECKGDYMFYSMPYREKKGILRLIYAIGYATVMIQKTRNLSPAIFAENVRKKMKSIDRIGIKRDLHKDMFFSDNYAWGIKTTGIITN